MNKKQQQDILIKILIIILIGFLIVKYNPGILPGVPTPSPTGILPGVPTPLNF